MIYIVEEVLFSKYNPAGNMTVLIHSNHSESDHALIANKLMNKNHLFCEQVGFIQYDFKAGLYELKMAGNEFCGNALISFLHFIKENSGNNINEISVKVSGTEELVSCLIHYENYYEIELPSPKTCKTTTIEVNQQEYQSYEINYSTYIHYVIPILKKYIDESLKFELERFLMNLEIPNYIETVGLLLFDEKNSYLTPCIYVTKLKSVVWERSCASGAGSIGYFLLSKYKNDYENQSLVITQPGGKIGLQYSYLKNCNPKASIVGQVQKVAAGTAYLE